MSSSGSRLTHGPYRHSRPGRGLPGRLPSREFIQRANLILRGDTRGRVPWADRIRSSLTPHEMHQILLQRATERNGSAPVAARFQTHPERVCNLVSGDSVAASVARHGILYRFRETPTQIRYPRGLRLNKSQTFAVEEEISRLHGIGAIERAPDHDGHKALLPTAAPWEKSPQPPGRWPRAPPVPVLSLTEMARYDHSQRKIQQARRAQGLPYRDFESSVFVVPKSDGGFRLCTDLRALNHFQALDKFKLDGLPAIAAMIQPGDYGSLVDIKDCFVEFGLHPSHRRYCRFRDPQRRRWQWRTMCFGMAEAPHLCTRVLRPFIRILRGLGIRCLIYLDDLLVLSQSPSSLAASMGIAMELLQDQLQLQLKLSKCDFSPSQVFTALGIRWDTRTMTCSVPRKRIKNISSTATRILNHSGAGRHGSFDDDTLHPVRTRDLARLVGQCVSTSMAIRPAKRRLLFIQQLLGKAIRRKGWNGTTSLTSSAVHAIRWWTTSAPFDANGNDIVPRIRPIVGNVTSDAATHNAGWGGTLTLNGREFQTRGFFSAEERSLYINNLELLGCRKTVESLLPIAMPDRSRWTEVHLNCELDNVAAIKYGRVGVSRSLGMSVLGADFWDWREQHHLSLSFAFLPGILNVTSDGLSRVEMTPNEWKLSPRLFRTLCRHLRVRPQVDLFASAHNHQCPRFYSYTHDSCALGTNAFAHPWGDLGTIYAYPPPSLVSRVIQRLRTDRVRSSVLVVPAWLSQSWWPLLMEMLTSPPLLLPNVPWLTQDQWDHPTWPCRWSMIAVTLSADLQHARACRRRYFNGSGTPGSRATTPPMILTSHGSPTGGRMPPLLLDSVRTAFGADT